MYYTMINNQKAHIENPQWVKLQSNGVPILCDEKDRHGVIIDGEIYHIDGRSKIEYPTIVLYHEDNDQLRLLEESIIELAQLTLGGAA